MRKYLLPETGNFYKANLHLHSVISDGALTPEQWKENYMARGYSILAYTDHDTFVTHNDLTDDKFLALNGYELALGANGGKKTCHLCAIRLTDSEELPACLSDGVWILEKQNKPRPSGTVGYYNGQNLSYTGECISRICQDHVDSGFFVTYNHPEWSGESYPDYISYNNMHAMEIVNYSCQVEGHDEYNSMAYNDMLMAGKRIYCTATDDAHGEWGAYGGFTMIKAEKLEYETIMGALERGDFYASTGPEIKELYMEDNIVHVSCSEAVSIFLLSERRFTRAKRGTYDAPVTEAEFDITKYLDETKRSAAHPFRPFFRIEVRDAHGKVAYSRPFFVDELN